MKKYILYYVFGLCIACFTACEEDFSSKEYYKYLIYLLSKEDYNVYTEVYPFSDGKEVAGYFSVACGGSQLNPEEIIVELETDTVLYERYNLATYDVDETRWARILSPNKYRIETMRVVFQENNPDKYVKVRVTVATEGLSPDSTYFIPLAIKSVSGGHEVNPDKYNMLFRVTVENEYAEQRSRTYYLMRGNTLTETLEAEEGSTISATKLARALSQNSIRVVAGTERIANPDEPTLREVESTSIVLTVDANNQVQITPYKSDFVMVEQFDGDRWNTYERIRNNMVDETTTQFFYLRYRYRTLKTPATETELSVWNDWAYVQETLRRQ